jgi:NADPH:quinone reductase-like Zn-dependent oxidoreductase
MHRRGTDKPAAPVPSGLWENAELVRSLGADEFIDRSKEDFTRRSERYDVLIDASGDHSARACRRVLAPGGFHGFVGSKKMSRRLGMLLRTKLRRKGLAVFIAKGEDKDLLVLNDLFEAGKIRPVIDRSHPLERTPEALAYLETYQARGKVLIEVA